ncbi:MAG: sodium/solute symporter [Planctomycetaceae bacterium]|nr:sodium/solute symporter [Planctomycetaceae bacterium]
MQLAIHPVDVAILIAYLLGVTLFGIWLGRGQKDMAAYLLGDRNLPWWAVLFSIVATETSTVTFLSIPGLTYAKDGNMLFLQLTLGYIVGRFLVVYLFLSHYFRGDLYTAYEVLDRRFGGATKQVSSILFIVTRNLADGLRLFLTAIVLEQVFGIELWIAVIAIGLFTMVYTFAGGLKSVVWNDCIQFFVYVAGAVLALLMILAYLGARSTEISTVWANIPGGWETMTEFARSHGKFRLLDFSFDLTKNYTFWSGLIGGTFVALASHGTDQLMVQRYLSAKNVRVAGWALGLSGFVVAAQFALFLLIGVGLACFFDMFPPEREFASTDQVFSAFVVHYLPVGVVGLIVAAVFSAAMSTVSGSLNSSASAAVNDLYIPWRRTKPSPQHLLWVSRILTAVFGVFQIAVGIAGQLLVTYGVNKAVVESVLAIAGFTIGVVLGVFFLGVLIKRATKPPVLVGLLIGVVALACVIFKTNLASPWYAIASFTVGIVLGPLCFAASAKPATRLVVAGGLLAGTAWLAGTVFSTKLNWPWYTIAGFTIGVILSAFLLGSLAKRPAQPAALVGLVVGLATMGVIVFTTKLAWPWYAIFGSSITFAVGSLAAVVLPGMAGRDGESVEAPQRIRR